VKGNKVMKRVDIFRRKEYYDVYINKVRVGSGSWSLVNVAIWFYQSEGMKVEVYDERLSRT